jgi:hypothetical protein
MVSEQAWEGVLQQATSAAVPAVFKGLNSSWPAVEKWAGIPGLDYLTQLAGHAEVQVNTHSCPDADGSALALLQREHTMVEVHGDPAYITKTVIISQSTS